MSELKSHIIFGRSNLQDYFTWLNGTSDSSSSTEFPVYEQKIIKSLVECGKKVVNIPCDSCLGYKTIVQRCQNRLCTKPECLKYRQYRTLRRYEHKIKAMRYPRFVTLTLQGYHEKIDNGLISSINNPWKLLSQFYRRKGSITSYIKALEIKENEYPVKEAGVWTYRHYYTIHAHIIYDGRYILFEQLQNKWKGFTHGSWHVRIEKPRSRFKIRSYLMKYVSKGSELEMSISDYMAIRKAQFFSSYNLPDSQDPPTIPLRCPDCDSVCSLHSRKRKKYPGTFSYRTQSDNRSSPLQDIKDAVIFHQGISISELIKRSGTDEETAVRMIVKLQEEYLSVTLNGCAYYE